MAGGYSGNDGPVFMTLTIDGCSVTDSTITGKGSVGGIIGHGSCSAWTDVIIVNSTVSGNTITSTGSSNNKAGSVMGTIGAAGQPTTADGVTKTGGMSVSVTTADNTVKSADKVITTIYGRQGTPTGLLEIAGGTYEAYPIEENVNYAAPKEGYIIFENADGKYGVKEGTYVAQINGVKYETLASALAAAQDGATVELLWAEGNAPIAMNGSVYGKSVTITGTATVDWSKGFLFVGRGGEGNGTVIFDNANLASASNNASTGIHVSGREKNTNNKYDGTVVINNSTIVLDYLIDKGAMTMTNSTLTVKNGFAVGGRPASETESGVDATATFDLTNGSTLIVNNHNGMGLGYEAIGVMTIDSTSTFECTLSFLVTGKGALNVAKGGQVELTGTEKKLTVNGTLTSAGNVFANIVAGENADIEISGGVYTQDVEEWCAEGYQSVKQPGEELWQVGKLPNAEVVNMGPTEITEYQIFNGSGLVAGPETPINLQVALEFIAKDTPAQAAENAYGQYITDFYITIDGAAEGSFTADGCYLAGNYGTFGWIMIPLDEMVIENGVVHPVITSAFAGNFEFTYENICSSVKDFKCGIYFSPGVLAANPDLSVSLNLGLSETIEKAQNAEFTSAVEKPFVYDVRDMTSAVAISGPDYFTTVTGAVEAALVTGDFVKLVNNAVLEGDLELGGDLVLNLGGKTLTADDKTLAIADSVVTITNGTLSGFTKDNITLTGNAILTVTEESVAASFRMDADYYVSQNANGTHSIMLKSAFRVFITMVDGEPRIGFFKDRSGSAPTYTLLGATSLENLAWKVVNYIDVDDAAGASTLPLYWAKLDQAADDTKVYRFFKIGPAPAAE